MEDQVFFKKRGGLAGSQRRRDYLKSGNKYPVQTMVCDFLHPEISLVFLPSNHGGYQP